MEAGGKSLSERGTPALISAGFSAAVGSLGDLMRLGLNWLLLKPQSHSCLTQANFTAYSEWPPIAGKHKHGWLMWPGQMCLTGTQRPLEKGCVAVWLLIPAQCKSFLSLSKALADLTSKQINSAISSVWISVAWHINGNNTAQHKTLKTEQDWMSGFKHIHAEISSCQYVKQNILPSLQHLQ